MMRVAIRLYNSERCNWEETIPYQYKGHERGMNMAKRIYEEIDEGGGFMCRVAFCSECGSRLYGADICPCCGAEITDESDE